MDQPTDTELAAAAQERGYARGDLSAPFEARQMDDTIMARDDTQLEAWVAGMISTIHYTPAFEHPEANVQIAQDIIRVVRNS